MFRPQPYNRLKETTQCASQDTSRLDNRDENPQTKKRAFSRRCALSPREPTPSGLTGIEPARQDTSCTYQSWGPAFTGSLQSVTRHNTPRGCSEYPNLGTRWPEAPHLWVVTDPHRALRSRSHPGDGEDRWRGGIRTAISCGRNGSGKAVHGNRSPRR
jgi:hypothetical protein